MKRKIGIITGSRAEYGLLKKLIEEVYNDKNLELQLFVTGTHLEERYGETSREIERDGFPIHKKVKILDPSNERDGVCRSVANVITGFSEAFQMSMPDLVVVLGDRFEILGATIAATIHSFPVAHIHGGELTLGAIDDAFRHSITKMSYWHFPSTEEYKDRVIRLGESPSRVNNFGALCVDNITKADLFTLDELAADLDIKFQKKNFLITYHPLTIGDVDEQTLMDEFLGALSEIKNTAFIFTMPNADVGGQKIEKRIKEFVNSRADHAYGFSSLGVKKYLSLMKHVDAVVGNSSSGVIEAPVMGVPTINIGSRQEGRFMPESVISVSWTKEEIRQGLKQIDSDSFHSKLQNIVHPFGPGGTALKIKNFLKNCEIPKTLKKEFYE